MQASFEKPKAGVPAPRHWTLAAPDLTIWVFVSQSSPFSPPLLASLLITLAPSYSSTLPVRPALWSDPNNALTC